MKRIFALAALTGLFSLGLSAQNAVESFKNSMKGKRAMVEFDIDAEVSGTNLNSKGFALFEGDCFMLSAPELQVYCDGQSVWLMDLKAEEVTIEEGKLDLDELVSSGSLSTKGNRITRFEFDDPDGNRVKLAITNYDFIDKGPAADFTPDLSKLSKSWIITDLR